MHHTIGSMREKLVETIPQNQFYSCTSAEQVSSPSTVYYIVQRCDWLE